MKSASNWAQQYWSTHYPGDPRPEFEDEKYSLESLVIAIQADAAADMRERCAKACWPGDPNSADEYIPERRECAQAIRALPLEEP